MPPLPMRWLGENSAIWREQQAELLRVHGLDEFPKQVEAFVHQRQLVVRFPGVEVLERETMARRFKPSTVRQIWGHRPSGDHDDTCDGRPCEPWDL
jgi:asparagine synthetase A